MPPIRSISLRRSLAILVCAILCIASGGIQVDAAAQRSPKKKAASAKAQRSNRSNAKASGKSRGANAGATARSKKGSTGKRRGRARSRGREVPISSLSSIRERDLAPGVRYTMYRSNGSRPVVAHVISMDRTLPGTAVRLVKGENHGAGLERLGELYRRYEAATDNKLFALVNGNFWRAVRNTMIGPCVIDGEVVEMNRYKKWTSGFLDVRSQLTIDTFAITGTVAFSGRSHSVSSVNRREDEGVVVYNSYGGERIPHVNAKEVEKDFYEAVKDSVFAERDSTEIALTKEVLRGEVARAQREASTEYPMVKIRVRYLRLPSINTQIPCAVLGVDTGTVAMPLRGAVISMPRSMYQSGPAPRIGDTLMLTYATNVHSNVRFMNAVCGTPRLVRDGVAKHEAQSEGSTGKRFIGHNLARTALGTDRSGNRIMIVAIQADDPGRGSSGATLQQTAKVMALLGCYQAMNLDGGGSTGMVVENDHVFFDGADPLTRRVGLGIGVVQLSKILRTPR